MCLGPYIFIFVSALLRLLNCILLVGPGAESGAVIIIISILSEYNFVVSAFSDSMGSSVSFVRVGELCVCIIHIVVIVHILRLYWDSNVIGLSLLVFIGGLRVEVLSHNRLVRVGVRFHIVVVLLLHLLLLLCALLGN